MTSRARVVGGKTHGIRETPAGLLRVRAVADLSVTRVDGLVTVRGYPTPEEAAQHEMPQAITHIVETRYKPTGDLAYVLLAIEVEGGGYYLDENLCYRGDDGSWLPGDNAGAGFTDRSLQELRSDPPPRGLSDSLDDRPWSPRAEQ
jgi:hypothetical protein